MSIPPDRDVLLESIQEEFRSLMDALNHLYHPVHPADPRRVSELEWRRDDLQRSIRARRLELGMAAAGATAVGRGQPQPVATPPIRAS